MKVLRGILCCALVPILAVANAQEESVKERMFRDLDTVRNTFAAKYAPAEWKKEYANWELETEISRAKEQLGSMEKLSVKGFQRTVRDFLNSTKDYHVSVNFWSTETATLPIRVCEAKSGAYYITAVDSSKLPLGINVNIGDELLLFDGRPTGEVVQELKQSELADASPATDQCLAEIYLTSRSGNTGLHVPQGSVFLTTRSIQTGSQQNFELPWDYQWEFIKDPPLTALSEPDNFTNCLGKHSFFKKKMTLPLFEKALCRIPQLNGDPNALGDKTSFVPSLGRELWHSRSREPFDAYIFVAPSGKLVGYIRIPHYSGSPELSKSFGNTIDFLDRYTDTLVIDQVNNPGGSVLYLYSLLSYLTDQPLVMPKHRMTLTQEDVYFAIQNLYTLEQVRSDQDARAVLGDTLDGYPVNLELAKQMVNHFYFTIDQWNAGHPFTTPSYLYGIDNVDSNQHVRYTKPILLLVNQLCFSGGDFLPAILQDNKRATVFGMKTAGAGGYVDECRFANPFGIASISYTASIAERIDSNPIENLGVTPDIEYDLTESDLVNDYSSYKQAVLDAVESLLQQAG